MGLYGKTEKGEGEKVGMGGGGEGGRKADNVRWYDRIVSPRSMIYRKSIDHLRN